jgi:hypothetical protein
MITEFLNCEEKKAWVIIPKSKAQVIAGFMLRKMMVLLEAVLLPKGSVRSLVRTFKSIIFQ